MAPVGTTSSPRDHEADNNPDLARKRQRLSEDPGASPEGSVVIQEVGGPEDMGSNMDNAIQIEDESGFTAVSYVESFQTTDPSSPWEQLRQIEQRLSNNSYVETSLFYWLCDAFANHIEATQNDSGSWGQHYLESDVEFFSLLANVSWALLGEGDLFERMVDIGSIRMQTAVINLLLGLQTLCRRIIPLLPDVVKTALSRRDSAHGSTPPQTVVPLNNVILAVQVFDRHGAAVARFLDGDRSDRLLDVVAQGYTHFADDNVILAITTLIQDISGSARQLANSWQILGCALTLFRHSAEARLTLGVFARDQVEEVLQVLHQSIRPSICGKHPRALPTSFHELFLNSGEGLLHMHTQDSKGASAGDLYERFLKSPSDALIPQTIDNDSISNSLMRISGRNLNVVNALLGTSWFFQGALAFLRSDIMDVRNAGIVALKIRLSKIYGSWGQTNEGFEHPIVQYAVRFLRENEMTAYIFGPESHAGLINQGRDVIVFLAATGTHTNIETDIMWQTGTTSVEADFAKAAFMVLKHVLQFLNMDQLFYIAEKYATTPIAKLGQQALDLFPEMVMAIECTTNPNRQPDGMRLAFISIRLLKHADNEAPSIQVHSLRYHAMAAIANYAGSHSTLAQRAEIYKHCVPEVLGMTRHATTAFEVLKLFLDSGVPKEDITFILSLLPVSAAVDELCHSARAHNGDESSSIDTHGVTVRLGTILSLMETTEDTVSILTCERLFSDVFGSADIVPAVRNAAWEELRKIGAKSDGQAAATRLWENFMQEHVPSLSADLVTAQLVDVIWAKVKYQRGSTEIQTDYTRILQLPLWNAIVRFALSSTRSDVVKVATTAVLDMLFDFPLSAVPQPASVSHCHGEFTRVLLKTLSQDFENLAHQESPVYQQQFLNCMDLLLHVLRKSQETTATLGLIAGPETLVVEAADNAPDGITFDIQIHSSEIRPTTVHVIARQSTTVTDLLLQLPNATGTAQNRVMAGGLEITKESGKTLSEVGVYHTGVLMICPKFAFGHDIDKAFTPAGPVEREILAQYSSIEAFLSGGDRLSEKTFYLLSNVRLSFDAREKVASKQTCMETLFPPNKPFRTRYSLFVLQKHQHDFTRLAVVDQDFHLRGVQLLTDLIMDETRELDGQLLLEVVNVLTLFLCERPADQFQCYFLDPEGFASRMHNLLSSAKDLPCDVPSRSGHTPLRTELSTSVYYTLLLACEADDDLWQAVSSCEAKMAQTHERLLLDEIVDFSERIAEQITSMSQPARNSRDMAHFFWRTLFPVLSAALNKNGLSANYFTLLVSVLDADHTLQRSEDDLRQLANALITELSTYQHTETPDYLLPDHGIAGLLQLLSGTVKVLMSHNIPLRLDDLPPRLLEAMLFPTEGHQSYPLVSPPSRSLVYDLMRSTYTVETDYISLLNTVRHATGRAEHDPTGQFPGAKEWVRPANTSAGLMNLGMTCYMNSLLQQLFANLQFRKFILDQPVLGDAKQPVLSALQSLFGYMQNHNAKAADTLKLANILGVQIGVQEDVHTFYTTMLSRLEDNMPGKEQKRSLTKFFTGKSVTQVKGDCGHVSSREESFTELSVTVKEKGTLHESLDEFVQGEPLAGANKYKCMTCEEGEGKLVTAMRRTCLEEVPDSLTLCLKRFAFENIQEGENKINDRFDFPEQIDMSVYKRDYLEAPQSPHQPDFFELAGVIVHQGSLSFGHYWSYVRTPGLPWNHPDAWTLVEDTKSTPVSGGSVEVRKQCLGGSQGPNGIERVDNGYVLFYQRNTYAAQGREYNIVPASVQHSVLPRVEVPRGLSDEIVKSNLWRVQIAALFDDEFGRFVAWLLAQFSSHAVSAPTESDEEISPSTMSFQKSRSHEPDEEMPSSTSVVDLDACMGETIAQFALRVLVADPDGESKLAPLEAGLTQVLTTRPTVADYVLQPFCKGQAPFKAILNCRIPKVRSALYDMIQTCLISLHERDLGEYESVADAVIRNHSAMLEQTIDTVSGDWAEYLAFASGFATQGQYETRLVLANHYLEWIFEVMYMRWDVELRKKHPTVWQWMRHNFWDHTPLFAFLLELLSAHVDLSVAFHALSASGDERVQTSRGWCLTIKEFEAILTERSVRQQYGDKSSTQWLLYTIVCRFCECNGHWADHAPSKLIGLLVGDGAHPDLFPHVERRMIRGLEFEEAKLQPLLWTSLHFCENAEDQLCKSLVSVLSNTVPQWKGQERKALHFFKNIHAFAPVSVIDTLLQWLLHEKFPIILASSKATRNFTCDWVQDHLFTQDVLSGNSSLDASRIHTTRKLVKVCSAHLRNAYRDEAPRGKFEAMFATMKNARDFLFRLRTEVSAVLNAADDDETPASVRRRYNAGLSPEVMVQYDESKTALSTVENLLADLEYWEPDQTGLPTRSLASVIKTVESEDQGDTEADGEGEDMLSESGESEDLYE